MVFDGWGGGKGKHEDTHEDDFGISQFHHREGLDTRGKRRKKKKSDIYLSI